MTTHHAKKKPSRRGTVHGMPIADIVEKAIVQAEVPIQPPAIPAVADKVADALTGELLSGKKAIVETKPASKSKTIWTLVSGAIVAAATYFWPDLPPDLVANILAGDLSLTVILAAIWKIWFTNTVTPSSIGG